MNILISACLLGLKCRYDGKAKCPDSVCAYINRLKKTETLIPFCPEIYGGLPTPRPPAEINGGRVINKEGKDVTDFFRKGAEEALKTAEFYGCRFAILKERSPSCGSKKIYDGTFSGTLTEGDGITASLLGQHGIRIFGETEIPLLIEILNKVSDQ